MADTKLQELIDTLKKQGVDSGEAAGKQLTDEAQKKADEILASAKAEADKIISQARAEADNSLKQLQSSMEIAASQFVTSLKIAIEQNLIAIPMKKLLEDSLDNTEFLKEIIGMLIKEFTLDPTHNDLEIMLSPKQQDRLADFAIEVIKSRRKEGGEKMPSLNIKTGGVEFGFMVSEKDDDVQLDFTSDAFLTQFLRFLSPRFRKFFKEIKLGAAAK